MDGTSEKLTALEVCPVPETDVDESSAEREVEAHLRDRIGRRKVGQTDIRELRPVELVVVVQDQTLVVRCTVLEEERCRHKLEGAPAKDTSVVAEREDKVADGHTHK